jgi:hypothetical protein
MTSAELTPMYTQEQLGNGGYNANASVGAFFWWERLDSVTVNLYEYCLGHGIAGWELSSEPHKIRVQDFTLNESNITITTGDTAHIQAIITPTNATDQDVTWRYSPTNRFSKLSSDGLTATFTSTKEETYTITAILGDRTATCEVTITPATATSHVLNATNLQQEGKYLHNGQIHVVNGGKTYTIDGKQL